VALHKIALKKAKSREFSESSENENRNKVDLSNKRTTTPLVTGPSEQNE
jgi:hypothetical protein